MTNAHTPTGASKNSPVMNAVRILSHSLDGGGLLRLGGGVGMVS
jgi:hypothetical protein